MHLLCLFFASIVVMVFSNSVAAQNITPQPTPLSVNDTRVSAPTPTPVVRLRVPVTRIRGARLEAIAGDRVVFSEHSSIDSANVPIYYWEPGIEELLETEEEGISGSVVADETGTFIVFLFNEFRGRDINGDGLSQFVLRLYHFETRQIANFPLPAQSVPDSSSDDWKNYEYRIKDSKLVYSVAEGSTNSREEEFADWYIVEIPELFNRMIGTPTPTPTPTMDAAIPTPVPTFQPTPPSFQSADFNQDGSVNAIDLWIFHRFWGR